MKKRILTLLAVLALLVTCAVFAVQAESTEPAAPGVTLTGNETCPVCSTALNAIADWNDPNGHHVLISEDTELAASPAWGTAAQTILIRSSSDFTQSATAVKITTAGNFRLTKEGVAVKLTIYGDKATIESKMHTGNGGMFQTASMGVLKVYGDITLTAAADAVKPTSGGVLFVNKGTANFTGVTFDGTTATYGGAVYQSNGGSVSTFDNCVFKNCSTTDFGGAMAVACGTATISNCDYYKCTAKGNGGALYVDRYTWATTIGTDAKYSAATVTMSDSDITECTATTNGGAIYFACGKGTLTNVNIDSCTAANGGAMYFNANSYKYKDTAEATSETDKWLYPNVTVTGGATTTCSSSAAGGAYYNNNTGTITLTDHNITGCYASKGNGGAVYTKKGNFYIGSVNAENPSEIKECYASTNGGAVYVASGRFELTGYAKIIACANKGYAYSKGVRIQGGWMRVRDNAQIISTGTGYGQGINAINSSSAKTTASPVYIILAQNATVVGPNGEHTGNILVTKYNNGNADHYSQLWIQEDWDGEASVAYSLTNSSFKTSYLAQTPGEVTVDEGAGHVTNQFAYVKTYNKSWVNSTKSKSFDGALYAEATEGTPRIYGNTHLLLPYRATVMDKDGKIVEWQVTTMGAINRANALNAAENSQGGYYAQMRCDYNIKVGATTEATTGYLDLNGNNLTELMMNEGSKLYVFDTKTKAGNAGGTVALSDAFYEEKVDNTDPENPVTTVKYNTVAATEVLQTGAVTVGDKLYVTKLGQTVATVYPVEFKMTSVSLRAAQDALYYTASIKAHADVELNKSGVAVTVDPEATTDSLENFLYTNGTNSEGAYTGVLVKDILFKNSAEDATKPVIARAYVELADGTIFMSDAASYSLTTLVNAVVEQQYDKLEGTKLEQFEDLYNRLDAILGEELVALPVKDEE